MSVRSLFTVVLKVERKRRRREERERERERERGVEGGKGLVSMEEISGNSCKSVQRMNEQERSLTALK